MIRRSVISALVAAALAGSAFVPTTVSANPFLSGGAFSHGSIGFHVSPPAFRSGGAHAHYEGRVLPTPMQVCKGKNCPKKPKPAPPSIPGGCNANCPGSGPHGNNQLAE